MFFSNDEKKIRLITQNGKSPNIQPVILERNPFDLDEGNCISLKDDDEKEGKYGYVCKVSKEKIEIGHEVKPPHSKERKIVRGLIDKETYESSDTFTLKD